MKYRFRIVACYAIAAGVTAAHSQDYMANVFAESSTGGTFFNLGGYGYTYENGEYVYGTQVLTSALASLGAGTVTAEVDYPGLDVSASAAIRDEIFITGNGMATLTYNAGFSMTSEVNGNPFVESTMQVGSSVPGNSRLDYDSSIGQSYLDGYGYTGSMASPNGSPTYTQWQYFISQTFAVYDGETITVTQEAQVDNGTGPYTFNTDVDLDPSWGFMLTGGATYTTASGIMFPAATPEPASFLALGVPAIGLLLRRKRRG